ncbi:MAG: hypothetical protein HY689_02315 [Chloroflexi bacterium]|nr:hypothetical protein [Chloroflexota bacterium]
MTVRVLVTLSAVQGNHRSGARGFAALSMTPWSAALALILVVALALALPHPAAAEPSGVITGQVVNRTASGGSVAGVEVTLYTFRNEAQHAQRTTTADADGNFRFEGLETTSEYVYQVVTLYAGLPYGSGVITFDPEESEQSVQVGVYETTQENPGIYAETASLIIAGIDPETETMLALEIVELVNPSDRTFLPTPGGPQGPMGLVRFSLPPDATDLTAQMGMTQEEMIQVDRGFAMMAPLPPGPREVMYAYRFPYKDGQVSFSKNLLYGARVFTLLTVEGAGQVSSPQLVPQDPAQIQGRQYAHLRGSDLAPNSALEVTLTGLPQGSGLRLPFDQPPPGVWAGAGVALALAAVAAMVLRRPSPATAPPVAERSAAAEDTGAPVQEIQDLLEALAALDDRHATGGIDEAAYRTERSALQDDLKRLLREHDIHLVGEGAHER